MPTAEDLFRSTATESKAKVKSAYDTAESESKKAVGAAKKNIAAHQKDAISRLLKDAKTRGYTGGADPLQKEMVGGADRRLQSLDEGLGSRGMDFAARRAAYDGLYGKMESLAPSLARQFEARLAAAMVAAAGRGGRGGGGGGGGGGGSGSIRQTDTLTDEEGVSQRQKFERLLEGAESVDPTTRAALYALMDSTGWKPAAAQEALNAASIHDPIMRMLAGPAAQSRAWRRANRGQATKRARTRQGWANELFRDFWRTGEVRTSSTKGRTTRSQKSRPPGDIRRT